MLYCAICLSTRACAAPVHVLLYRPWTYLSSRACMVLHLYIRICLLLLVLQPYLFNSRCPAYISLCFTWTYLFNCILCCARRCLVTVVFAIPIDVSVLHLYISIYARPERIWQQGHVLHLSAIVLLLGVSAYMYIHKSLCCTICCTCTWVLLPHLSTSVYQSLCCTCTCMSKRDLYCTWMFLSTIAHGAPGQGFLVWQIFFASTVKAPFANSKEKIGRNCSNKWKTCL